MTIRPSHLLLSILILLLGCARQTTPNGGPQDKAPPKLTSSDPSNNQKNFKGNSITLIFNEDVKLKEPKEQIIISPSPGKNTTFLAKQERVIIQFKDKLQDSTTYSLSFREGIQDITESNSAENLHLAFSTGPTIDSLTIAGFVTDALTEKIPENITVAIYKSDTFNIFKHTPEYFTKTNKQGRFGINNLKNGQYHIYAFDDKNKNLKLETKSELFGFLPGQIDLTNLTDSLQLIMIHVDARAPGITSVRHADKFSTIRFNKALVSYTATTAGKSLVNAFGTDQTEVKFYFPTDFTDSLAATIHAIDSLQQTIDTVVYLKTGTAPSIKETLKTELADIVVNAETNVLTTQINFNKPIIKINLDSVYFRIDSTTTVPVTRDNLNYDTIRHRLELTKTLDKQFPLTTVPPSLFFSKYTFISIDGDSSKVLTKPFTILKPEETATLVLEIITNEPDFVVQLLSIDNKVVRSVRNTKKIIFRNILPTDYKVRVLLDRNDNNQWDPGNINKDIPPEKTLFYKNADGKYSFPIRANWEVGPYIISF